MILKGNQRGGAKDLALHLMKVENDHVEVYELRGFAAQTLMGALNEVYAVSRGTRCRQFLYSLSLNPPQTENVPTSDFVKAIEQVEKRLGLEGQPRAIVFHEKDGRRHAHAVWSRIDIENMKAVHMAFDHERLKDVSRELFLEHGWAMPEGLVKSESRDPRNFTLAEWQQAKRTGLPARETRAALQDAWAISDSKTAFVHALEERGFCLARGDRRSFVAVDWQGEVHSIPRLTNQKTRQVRERLGEASDLPAVGEVKRRIADDMLSRLGQFQNRLDAENREMRSSFRRRCHALVRRQRAERQALKDKIEQRRVAESIRRQGRFRKGLGGLWDRLRGEHRRIKEQNEREAEAAMIRDRTELDALAFRQLEQRRRLNIFRLETRQRHDEGRELRKDMEAYRDMRSHPHDPPRPGRSRRRRGFEPEL